MNKFLNIFFVIVSVSLFSYEDPLREISSQAEFEALYPSVSAYQIENTPTIARFFLVRHGENEANATGLVDGRTLNLPLTLKGIQDASQAGQLLTTKIGSIDLLLSSPMQRAQQTAQQIRQAFNSSLEIILDDRLLEKYYGTFEGGIEANYLLYKNREPVAMLDLFTFMDKFAYKEHPSVESYQEVYERMADCLLEYAKAHLGKNIIIATHGGSIRSLFSMGTANQHNAYVHNYRYKPTNGCLLMIESDGQTLEIKAIQGLKFVSP